VLQYAYPNNHLTTDPQKRLLVGHSMGGYGAVMNSMRTNMQYFGSVCGLSGGLYIWDLPAFQDAIGEDVVQEAIVRKNTNFSSCNYTQPPYRYYADDINYQTIITVSVALTFYEDGTTVPKSNSPYFHVPFVPDCTEYNSIPGFRYFLSANGDLDRSMFSIAPFNSPNGFVKLHYPTLQKSMNNSIYLSVTYQDELVDYQENVQFSQSLNAYNISHTLYIYNGTHYDVIPGVIGCITHFKDRVCPSNIPEPVPQPTSPPESVPQPTIPPSTTPEPTPQPSSPPTGGAFSLTEPLMPTWAVILAGGVALLLLLVVIVLWRSRKPGYERINTDFPMKK